MAEHHIEIRLNGKPLIAGDPEVQVTIDDIGEEGIHAWVYGQELWPEVITDEWDDDVING